MDPGPDNLEAMADPDEPVEDDPEEEKPREAQRPAASSPIDLAGRRRRRRDAPSPAPVPLRSSSGDTPRGMRDDGLEEDRWPRSAPLLWERLLREWIEKGRDPAEIRIFVYKMTGQKAHLQPGLRGDQLLGDVVRGPGDTLMETIIEGYHQSTSPNAACSYCVDFHDGVSNGKLKGSEVFLLEPYAVIDSRRRALNRMQEQRGAAVAQPFAPSYPQVIPRVGANPYYGPQGGGGDATRDTIEGFRREVHQLLGRFSERERQEILQGSAPAPAAPTPADQDAHTAQIVSAAVAQTIHGLIEAGVLPKPAAVGVGAAPPAATPAAADPLASMEAAMTLLDRTEKLKARMRAAVEESEPEPPVVTGTVEPAAPEGSEKGAYTVKKVVPFDIGGEPMMWGEREPDESFTSYAMRMGMANPKKATAFVQTAIEKLSNSPIGEAVRQVANQAAHGNAQAAAASAAPHVVRGSAATT